MANFPGTAGNDLFFGTPGSDTMTGDLGDDKLYGLDGDDNLDGGDGDDILDGGTGSDSMTGGIGNDVFVVDNVGDVVIEGFGGGSDLVFTFVDYRLPGDVERLAVYDRTSTFAVRLYGNAGNNELIGNDGVNIIDGGDGRDIMQGAGGDDVFVVSQQGTITIANSPSNSGLFFTYTFVRSNQPDVIAESAGGGIDTIWVPFTSSTSPHNAYDYALITGSSLSNNNNHLDRLGVYDRTTTYAVNLHGNELNNEIWGNDGPNLLNGFSGADILSGLGGDDTYFVDNLGDVVIESAGGGFDTIYANVGGNPVFRLPDHVERLIGNGLGSAITIIGNLFDNELVARNGNNDLIDGGAGADIMNAGAGNDIYIVDNIGDRVVETDGLDTIVTSVDYTLPQDVEQLRVNGVDTTFAINLTGNGQVNDIVGNDGANIIDGKAFGDAMHGRGGDDIYIVDNVGDTVDEAAGGGFDTIYTSVSYTLSANVERLAVVDLAGTGAIDLTGNAGDNEIRGNDGANVIDGRFGVDLLQGRGGADTFAFTTILVGADNADQILDFQPGTDRIALDDAIFTALTAGALPAGVFVVGPGAQDADDRIIYDPATGRLFYDTDGNGAAEQIHFATLSEGLSLTAGDFTVI
jgi:Ca2+-binding RTX toxin-like protein